MLQFSFSMPEELHPGNYGQVFLDNDELFNGSKLMVQVFGQVKV